MELCQAQVFFFIHRRREESNQMEGVITAWDASAWIGKIKSDGHSYIVKRQNMRRGTVLKVGDAVRFTPVNLFEGRTAQNVTVISSK
jgi:hypothetical protein